MAWNVALADVVYGPSAAGKPAYLDLEDETLERVRGLADPDASDPAAGLVGAVRETLHFGKGPAALLRLHLIKLNNWTRGDRLGPPPCLALLAVLSLAAENMHEDDNLAANNFYGRLAELLELTESQKDEFVSAYRRTVEQGATSAVLWASVGSWLEHLEGNRGLPTAFAVSHAHVGLPLSQALVRGTDRDRLHSAFDSFGLAPRSSLAPKEMAALIEEWVNRTPCPASNTFARLWRSDQSARERIVDVARLELESWNGASGAGNERSDRIIDSVRLVATRSTFPAPRMTIGLALPARTGQQTAVLNLLGADDLLLGELDFVITSAGWLTLADEAALDASSVLRGEVRLRASEGVATFRRRPRRLIPLRFDDLMQSFIETERVNLGEDHALLAHRDIEQQVSNILEHAARPGYRLQRELTGLPDGWTLFEGIQILSSIPDDLLRNRLVDLNVLQPIATAQMVFEGGLKLPGNIAKWSSLRQPELRVTADDSSALTASIEVVRALALPAPDVRTRHSDQAVLIWPLSSEHLPDGDYEIEVTDAAGAVVGQSLRLRLRSADNPAVIPPDDDQPVTHARSAPLFGFSAERSTEPGFMVAPSEDESGANARQIETSVIPGWRVARLSRRAERRTDPIFAPAPSNDSCILTGAHHMLLETASSGASSVEGVCRTCGLVKRYPTRGRNKRAQRHKGNARPAPTVRVRELAPVPEPVRVDWAVGFDALCHVGEGPVSALTRIAAQMESSEIFGDAFARRLETLGHIEIERTSSNLTSRSWKVTDPTFVGLPSGRCVLTGFRSERMLNALDEALYEIGVEMSVDSSADAPAVISVPSIAQDAMERLLERISEATNRPARHIEHAARSLSGTLPPFSELLERLPDTTAIGGRSIERWNAQTARFEAADDAGLPGAYRLNNFGRAYIYRRPGHIGTMSATLGNARLVKYAAALDLGQSLVGYDVESELLYVPLGADLPGLYGRAATLATGRPPHENTEDRVLEYRDVPTDLAARLIDLLSS